MMQPPRRRSFWHWQRRSAVSWFMPRLWPSSCATVDATPSTLTRWSYHTKQGWRVCSSAISHQPCLFQHSHAAVTESDELRMSVIGFEYLILQSSGQRPTVLIIRTITGSNCWGLSLPSILWHYISANIDAAGKPVACSNASNRQVWSDTSLRGVNLQFTKLFWRVW